MSNEIKTHIVVRIDNLNNVQIPKDVMRRLNLHAGDPIRISTYDKAIILHKHTLTCLGCYKDFEYREQKVLLCEECWKVLVKEDRNEKSNCD